MKKTLKNVIGIITELLDKSGKNAEQLQKLVPYLSTLLEMDISEVELNDVREACDLEPKKMKQVFFVEYHGGRTTDDIISAGGYAEDDSVFRNESRIRAEDFPMRARAKGRRIIEIIEGRNKEEILKKAKCLKLKKPLYEDVLLFGAKYPDVRDIVFWHEPFRAKFEPPKVLVHWWYGWRRILSLDCIDGDFDRYKFAFIRGSKKSKLKK
ncbi:MAG: hypothetical protein M0P97_03405 [Candidatus Moranbacteria bacterium]|jgi:hypothetical protein|nr:hypothetical protein [Candidatus Moranbacteria bacterium]